MITIALQNFEQFWVQYLHQILETLEMLIHCRALWKVGDHTFHQLAETSECHNFVIEYYQEWRR